MSAEFGAYSSDPTAFDSLAPPDKPLSGRRLRGSTSTEPTTAGLDYLRARYLSSDLGRFITPDWSDQPTEVPYAKMGDPQTLNLFAYLRSNPTGGVDLDGHCGPPENSPNCSFSAPPFQPNNYDTGYSGGYDTAAANGIFVLDCLDAYEASHTYTIRKKGHVRLTMRRYSVENRPGDTPISGPGLRITITAKVTGASFEGYDWSQTVTRIGGPGDDGQPHPDPPIWTYYWIPSDAENVARDLSQYEGENAYFSDSRISTVQPQLDSPPLSSASTRVGSPTAFQP